MREKNKMESTEKRKKEKHDKKFAKQVHSDRLQKKAKEKREAINELDAMKSKGKRNKCYLHSHNCVHAVCLLSFFA